MRTAVFVVAAVLSMGLPRVTSAQQPIFPALPVPAPPPAKTFVVPFVVPPLAVTPSVVCGMTILPAPNVDPKIAKDASRDPKPLIAAIPPKECTSKRK